MTLVSYNASTFRDAEGNCRACLPPRATSPSRRSLEEQLRESQAYNRRFDRSVVDGLITVDPSGSISDVNETDVPHCPAMPARS